VIRIRRGTALLNKVVKQFDQAVADLEAAAQHIEDKRLKTLDKITDKQLAHMDTLAGIQAAHDAKQAKLNADEYALYLAGKKAQTVRDNIAKLVGA
jgi:hypothetical protein